jgi:putative DNA primase/helicase
LYPALDGTYWATGCFSYYLTKRSARSTAKLVILETSAVGPYASHGTLEGWIGGVAKLAGEHHLPMFAMSVAFAGPLLFLANEEGGGVNLFEDSSTGKTTMGQAAASVWGRGSTSSGFVKAWRTTGNALGAIAASVTDTLLVLDEISVIEGREAGAAIYGLANGTDKARLNRDSTLKETRT